jgi:hypothetical protein
MSAKKTAEDYIEIARCRNLKWLGKLPKGVIQPVDWTCLKCGYLWKTSYWNIQRSAGCLQCYVTSNRQRTKKYFAKNDVIPCKECKEPLSISHYPIRYGYNGKYLRFYARCKICLNERHRKYRIKYASKRDVQIQKNQYLSKIRQEPGRCKNCTKKTDKLGLYQYCRTCHVVRWIDMVWNKLNKAQWFHLLDIKTKRLVENRYQYLRSITGKCDLINLPGANLYPHTKLANKKPPQQQINEMFTISSIQWTTLSDQQRQQLPTENKIIALV